MQVPSGVLSASHVMQPYGSCCCNESGSFSSLAWLLLIALIDRVTYRERGFGGSAEQLVNLEKEGGRGEKG